MQHTVTPKLIIKRISTAAQYKLIHTCMGHPGERVMQNIHQHVDGVPKVMKPPLYKCATYTYVNITKRGITQKQLQTITNAYTMKLPKQRYTTGQAFLMDMGFVRGTKYSRKDDDGNLVTSIDGYNSYLLIVDRATRYTWIFLSKTKHPQVHVITEFLKLHGTSEKVVKTIRTDEGGELWGSHLFQQAVRNAGYLIEPTASVASFQNGIAERPNRTFGDMLRSLLHGEGLGPEYWSWALLYSVYLKNRLPHRSIASTPYEGYTGT
jgi:hypothetical protein